MKISADKSFQSTQLGNTLNKLSAQAEGEPLLWFTDSSQCLYARYAAATVNGTYYNWYLNVMLAFGNFKSCLY